MTSDKLTMEQIAKLLELPTPDEFSDGLMEYCETYSYVYREAIEEGASEEDAEERVQKAQQEEQDEAYGRYRRAVEQVAEKLFREHGLEFTPVKVKGKVPQFPWEYRVYPIRTWQDAANNLRETINGVGMFYFGSLKEFLSSGPYTPRETTLQHLHWIKWHPKVYGDYDASYHYNRAMRY